MRPLKNLENKIPSYICYRVQLIFTKVQAHISSEPPLERNQDETPLTNQGFSKQFFNRMQKIKP